MALFTDGPVSSIEELHGYDTQLLDVARIEGIDVTRKLADAQEEMGIDLQAMLARMNWPWGIWGIERPIPLNRVVVTSPLKLWHAYRALEMVYRDAYNSQLNDRYAGKRDQYGEMARSSHERVIQSGLGMTADPIPQAPTPAVHPVAGGLPDGTYYAGVAWTNAKGEEGACSLPAKIAVTGSSFAVVHGQAPANAVGWHVYAGGAPALMLRQNGTVLTLSSGWTQPDVIAAGVMAGSGQGVGYVQSAARVIQRG